MLTAGWSAATDLLLHLLEVLLGIPLAALLVRLLAPARADIPDQRVPRRDEILQTCLLVALSFPICFAISILFVGYPLHKTSCTKIKDPAIRLVFFGKGLALC